MNAREVTRVMMGFEAKKCIDALEALAEIAGSLDYKDVEKQLESAREHVEAAATGLHIPELFSEGKDE
nr:MAG TPA: hypothetical protein [Caudoviricetes sp.]DAR67187.1 MAG TPA: hypothetical protein [Caudoviricetes sp.]